MTGFSRGGPTRRASHGGSVTKWNVGNAQDVDWRKLWSLVASEGWIARGSSRLPRADDKYLYAPGVGDDAWISRDELD
ncbi:hypothetical protein GE21DRAFT_628 [Neurospora crassa]|uniref:Uncharacterized protein n=1 Tax=Neurospora crassa (strain ATCC 24698 / 74-OR23-1A / CBS 708.71 / DSM 1257 / FGSC 987) TaxID=367110 RepID=Q7SG98_NEUCR|nr:hypothetical protein NCU02465 [Neurospora crassa OR74A]EAA35823.1 hypothetical protein NCU02465 [Neurospora crassa OR74A]KHE80900.1 hypothetical protein GE21DRAFT_628 [Neurospora crassa]|eukprot:XP_965059.1 hypothetical protein NCU02465 [Neurospora crassa OR74A]